jgi:hypothetical protein
MDISIVEAYAKGRIAGVNHYFELQRNPASKQPTSPYPGSAYLAGVEWERGFSDGFQQGQRSDTRARTRSNEKRQAA